MILFLTLVVVFGIILVFADSFAYSVKEIGATIQGKRLLLRNNKRKKNKLERHLFQIANAMTDEGKEESFVTRLKLISAVLFIVSLIFTLKYFGISRGVLLSLFFFSLPYVFVRLKLAVTQRSGSFEGEFLCRELRNQYKANYGNMFVAIDKTVSNLTEKQAFAKRNLFKLSIRLKEFNGDDELEEILEDFAFTFNTSWSKILCQNIFAAISEKSNVLSGLEDLIDICNDIKMKLEEQKRGNTQNMIMAKFLAPGLAVFFYVLAVNMVSFESVVSYQFGTSGGILFGILIIALVIINIFVAILSSKPKYDI